MQFRFNAEEWGAMTPTQRMKRCAILGEEADKLAEGADGRFKPFYLEWLLNGNVSPKRYLRRCTTPRQSVATDINPR